MCVLPFYKDELYYILLCLFSLIDNCRGYFPRLSHSFYALIFLRFQMTPLKCCNDLIIFYSLEVPWCIHGYFGCFQFFTLKNRISVNIHALILNAQLFISSVVGAGGLGSEWVKGQIFLKFRKTKSSLRTSGFLYWIFSSPTIYFFRVLSLLLSLFCCSIVSYPTEKNTINEFNSPVEPTSWALFTGHQGPIDTNVKKCYLRNLHIWVLQVP